MTDFATARHNMVESQIRTNKVTDPAIIDAFEAVPRELFVPSHLMGVAYVDEDLDLDNGRVLMEPMVFARLLQIALPDSADEVLDIACGCGYSTAILSRLAGTVYGIEQDEHFVSSANDRLGSLDVDNAAVVAGNPLNGYGKKAPYSLIVIGGGVERIPSRSPNNSLMADDWSQSYMRTGRHGNAVLVEKFGNTISKRIVFDASVPLLPNSGTSRSLFFSLYSLRFVKAERYRMTRATGMKNLHRMAVMMTVSLSILGVSAPPITAQTLSEVLAYTYRTNPTPQCSSGEFTHCG